MDHSTERNFYIEFGTITKVDIPFCWVMLADGSLQKCKASGKEWLHYTAAFREGNSFLVAILYDEEKVGQLITPITIRRSVGIQDALMEIPNYRKLVFESVEEP